jgi:hypothetical protein
MTRGELLDRIVREQAYWHRKRTMTAEDREAEREFRRIMHAYIDPGAAMQATIDLLEGRPAPDYWETRPGDDVTLPPGLAMDADQRAAIEYGRMLAARMDEEEQP